MSKVFVLIKYDESYSEIVGIFDTEQKAINHENLLTNNVLKDIFKKYNIESVNQVKEILNRKIRNRVNSEINNILENFDIEEWEVS